MGLDFWVAAALPVAALLALGMQLADAADAAAHAAWAANAWAANAWAADAAAANAAWAARAKGPV